MHFAAVTMLVQRLSTRPMLMSQDSVRQHLKRCRIFQVIHGLPENDPLRQGEAYLRGLAQREGNSCSAYSRISRHRAEYRRSWSNSGRWMLVLLERTGWHPRYTIGEDLALIEPGDFRMIVFDANMGWRRPDRARTTTPATPSFITNWITMPPVPEP